MKTDLKRTRGVAASSKNDSATGAKHISDAAVARFPVYCRCLVELIRIGKERVSSVSLAKMMGTTASQVRQDFSNYGVNGVQGYGYSVGQLSNEFAQLMKCIDLRPIIVIGDPYCGFKLEDERPIGRGYVTVVGLFGINSEQVGKKYEGLTVNSLDEVEKFLAENSNVEMAVLSMDCEEVSTIVKRLDNAGIKGILNCSGRRIDTSKLQCRIADCNLLDCYWELSYRINEDI